MQRLLSLKLASKLSNSSTSSRPYKTFTSLSKSSQTHEHNRIFSSFAHNVHHHPCQSYQFFSERIHGFCINPLLAKKFLMESSDALSRMLSRSIADCRVGFRSAQFHKQRFQLYPGLNSQWRGRRSWFQRLTTNDAVIGLILANVAVFLLWRIADSRFMSKNFTISLENIRSGRVHTLITSAFSHIEIEHIISNMIGLYFFGMNIGRVFGPEVLLKLYLAGAVAGSVFYLVHHAFLASSSKNQQLWGKDPSRAQGLGASGAVNAIMLLDIFLFPKSTLYLEFIIPVPAILLGIFLIGKDILRILEKDSHISGSAHLGGAAVAALAWARLRRGRF